MKMSVSPKLSAYWVGAVALPYAYEVVFDLGVARVFFVVEAG